MVAQAYVGEQLSFGPEYLIPKPFDPRLMMKIAPAVARAAAESGVALEARVRRGAGLLFDRIARQAPLARLLMREAAETGERATYVLTQLMQPNLELYRPLWEEAMDAGILGRSDVVVAHTALVGAIASVISMRVSIARLSGREMELATLRDEFLDVLMRHGPQGASPAR